MFEALEDRLTELADEAFAKAVKRVANHLVLVDGVMFPVLPKGAVWPSKFQTNGEVQVTQWLEQCRCCGPAPVQETLVACLDVERDGDVVAVRLDFAVEVCAEVVSVSVEHVQEV